MSSNNNRIRILDFRIFRHFLEFIVPDEFSFLLFFFYRV